MKELYWITTIGRLAEFFNVAMILSWLGVGIGLFAWLFAWSEGEDCIDTIKKVVRYFTIGGFIFTLLAIFTPTSKEILAIYGVGSVIDYVQQSDEAKKLPDNAVKAINKWFEEITEEE